MATNMKKHPFHVHALTPRTYRRTTLWSLVMAVMIVAAAAGLARATKNFRGALVDKPDIAIYLLLEDEELGNTTLLREAEGERDYLADTKDGPKIVKLKKGEKEWYVALVEALHE
jgi:hypothetical protein